MARGPIIRAASSGCGWANWWRSPNHERLFLAAVNCSTGEEVEFESRETLAQPASAPRIVLMMAVIKFARLEWAIEKATELGVSSIVPVAAARCEARLIQAGGKRRGRWQRIAEEAAQQSRRLAPPSIEPPMPLIEALPKHDARLPIILDTDCPSLKKLAAGFRRKTKRGLRSTFESGLYVIDQRWMKSRRSQTPVTQAILPVDFPLATKPRPLCSTNGAPSGARLVPTSLSRTSPRHLVRKGG